MKSRPFLLMSTILVGSLILNACILPTFGTMGYNIHLSHDSGAIVPVGSTIHLVASIMYTSGMSPVNRFTFWANAVQLGADSSPDVYSDTSVGVAGGNGHYDWTPTVTGQYQVQVQGTMANGRIAISIPVRFCVINFPLPSVDVGAGGYTGPCPLSNPLVLGSTTFSMTAQATPDSLVYQPLIDSTDCPLASLTFQAVLNDPGSRAALVIVNYTARTPDGSGGGDSLVLNETSSSDIVVHTYSNSVNSINELLQANLTDSSGNPIPGSVVWTARAFDSTGATLATVGPNTIPVAPCSAAINTPPSHVIEPFPTETSAPNNLIANVQAYPAPIYYGDTCPSVSNLSFRSALVLPLGINPSQLQVLAHVTLDGSDGSPTGSATIPLNANGTFDTASGGSVFLGKLDLSRAYTDNGNTFDPASLGGANGSLHWWITVSNQNTELGRSAEQILKLAPCPTYSQPTSQPSSGTSGGNTCNLSAGYCQNLGKKLDTASCSCVP